MGKAKQKKKSLGAKVRNDPIKIDDPHLKKIHEEKVMPLIQKLKSINPTERSEALLACTHLVENDDCRKLLLKEYIIQTCLERLLNDDDFTVVVRAWGLLRNVAVGEGHDISLFLFRNDVLVPAKAAIQRLGTLLDGSQKRTKAEEALVWEYAENVAGLLWELAEISDEVNEVMCKENDVFLFLLHLMNPTSSAPVKTQETAAQALYTITVAQPGMPSEVGVRLLEIPTAPPILLRLLNDESVNVPLMARIAAAGIIHSTSSDDKSIATDPELLPRIMKLLEESCNQISSALRPSPEFTNGTKNADLALEVIGSIAMGAQDGEAPDEEDDGADGLGEEDDEMDDADDDKMSDDEEDETTEDVVEAQVHESDDEDLPDDLKNDMDMVVGSDYEDERPSITIPTVTENLFRQLIKDFPSAVFLIVSPTSTFAVSTQIRAITALANLAWTITSSLPKTNKLFKTWQTVSSSVWERIITPILASNTADVELADQISSLSWGIVKTGVTLSVSENQHRCFMALYQAAAGSVAAATPAKDSKEEETPTQLMVKAIGVLGGLAIGSNRIDVNKEIGVFLITLISNLPNSPTEPTLEALNVLMDIYADEDFDYDQPVFYGCGFLKHLEAGLPKVRQMVKKINRAHTPELRDRADEALENLTRFIQYKTKMQNKKKD
ncbi:ARM repeat-containing protein [Ascobolus immersus RN42]|uniref:ARM repeat-containing protein n=1 Tax=Ascobolus immersus RN42 TaxID=1160509 RepID=A0A3N4IHI9_ASCIM|nr:ARM repeat-containing protein [Ascobolus immersus RN42]